MKLIKHTHEEAFGEIKQINPWVEDSWTLGPFLLVHHQQLAQPELSSLTHPRHAWRLHIRGHTTARFIVQYGVAPRREP